MHLVVFVPQLVCVFLPSQRVPASCQLAQPGTRTDECCRRGESSVCYNLFTALSLGAHRIPMAAQPCTALAWLLHQQGCTCLPKETQLGCSPGKQLLLLGVPCVHVMGTCRTQLLRGTACALGLLSSLVWLIPISFLLRMTQMCINDYCSGAELAGTHTFDVCFSLLVLFLT